MIIDRKNLRFKCEHCGKLFKKCSECAEHIEDSSIIHVCFPDDIIMVDVKKESSK